MLTQQDSENGREQLPLTRMEREDKRATKGEAMTIPSDVWFLFASFTSLLRCCWPLIRYIHKWERTVNIRLKTPTRNPPVALRLQLNYRTHKNIPSAQVCEHPVAASCVHTGRDQHSLHPILHPCCLLRILQQLLQMV